MNHQTAGGQPEKNKPQTAGANGQEASLPLLHDGDALVLHLRIAERHIYLDSIDVYPGNQNVSPTVERYIDLTPIARRAVIDHIQRKYPGRTVHV